MTSDEPIHYTTQPIIYNAESIDNLVDRTEETKDLTTLISQIELKNTHIILNDSCRDLLIRILKGEFPSKPGANTKSKTKEITLAIAHYQALQPQEIRGQQLDAMYLHLSQVLSFEDGTPSPKDIQNNYYRNKDSIYKILKNLDTLKLR